ncbi:hypothetical protein [Streptomyces sp. NPDC050982]|uniref:hypothetical protein n=1 Tax=Streptomyces sp. NPDC050982 TaxID=3154746 RepID=UPI0033DD98C8
MTHTHRPIHRREYRYSGSKGWIWAAMAAPFAGAAGLTYDMAMDDGVPIAVPIAVGTAFAAMFVLLLLTIHATATTSRGRECALHWSPLRCAAPRCRRSPVRLIARSRPSRECLRVSTLLSATA